ncbi:MAG: HAMP domain-containing histidine kinase [Bacteroidales bacterium]|nr:HAMP domain-containing histidine kinase [Bacteroidales bacterium]
MSNAGFSEAFPETDPALQAGFTSGEYFAFIQEVLNSSPWFSAIIDQKRQVILSNHQLFDKTRFDNFVNITGKRPGDVFSCTHKIKSGTCGISENCQFCGILRTIRESQLLNKKATNECRFTASENNLMVAYDFRVTCSPVTLNGSTYTLLNLQDIGSEKRALALENVFFHDLMNRLSGLSGLIQAMKTAGSPEERDEYLHLLESVYEMVLEEVQHQRQLKAAEHNDLIVNYQLLSSLDIINSVCRQLSYHPVMENRILQKDPCCEDFRFATDGTLLKRILINMLKNAAEAVSDGETITICSRRKTNTVVFNVHNSGMIPHDLQLQLFQRSFSTKGPGRGLGNYSMKLLGENYLKGSVYFSSDESNGTLFTIELPLAEP